MQKVQIINNLLKDRQLTKKIYLYMSTASAGDYYDSYENKKTFTNLNPVIIKGYVTQLSAEALIYKQYGLHNQGAVQVICEKRFKKYFELSNKITIDDVEYQVFKEGTGGRTMITERPLNLIRVILSRNG